MNTDHKDKPKEDSWEDETTPSDDDIREVMDDEDLGADDGSLDWEVENMLETIGLRPKEIPMDRALYEGWI